MYSYLNHNMPIVPPVANYLHYGKALEYFKNSNLHEFSNEIVSIKDLICHFSNKKRPNKYALSVLHSCAGRKSKVDVKQFKNNVKKSLELNQTFHDLNCRGFSYKLITDFDFVDRLNGHIDLRFMLVGSPDLFYPPNVRRFMSQVQNVHYKENGFPSIAFAIGTKISDMWYILTMQSDLFFRSTYIRKHIRGWQKILFCIIAGQAANEGSGICLPRSCDIVKACYPPYFKPARAPEMWNCFYDYTAKYFGMELIEKTENVNCQVSKDGKPVYIDRFYCLKKYKAFNNLE